MTAKLDRMSFEQERLCGLERAAAGRPTLIHVMAVLLDGPLEENWLRRSIEEVAARHPALRSAFPVLDGHTSVDVAPALALALPVSDMTGIPSSQREAEIGRQVAEEGRRPFALA